MFLHRVRVVSSDSNQSRVSQGLVFAQLSGDSETIHIREANIRKDHSGRPLVGHGDSVLSAICHLNFMPQECEEDSHGIRDVVVVVNYEKPHGDLLSLCHPPGVMVLLTCLTLLYAIVPNQVGQRWILGPPSETVLSDLSSSAKNGPFYSGPEVRMAQKPTENRLLAQLPKSEYARLLPLLQPVVLHFNENLYETGATIDHAYFPNSGCLSALAVMKNGDCIEVATIGNEGMMGLTVAIGAETSPNKVIVQVAGDGLRMKAKDFKREFEQDSPFRQLLFRYHSAFLIHVSYSAACNGLHPVQQRCCRWLLMTHDRVHTDEIRLTHEFLSYMLGVRRPTVTEVLQPLQDAGLIGNTRGTIKILDRAGLEEACCECYQNTKDEYERLLGEQERPADRPGVG
jgi:CRP-like cAMP-binding protein